MYYILHYATSLSVSFTLFVFLFKYIYNIISLCQTKYSGTLGYVLPGMSPNHLMPFPYSQILHQHASPNLTHAHATSGTTVFLPLSSYPKPKSCLRSDLCPNWVVPLVMEWIKDITWGTIALLKLFIYLFICTHLFYFTYLFLKYFFYIFNLLYLMSLEKTIIQIIYKSFSNTWYFDLIHFP